MKREIDWEEIPEAEYEAYKKRLEIVELILDGSIDTETTERLRQRYCEENRVSRRTVANYVRRYRDKGSSGLLFYRPRPKSPRIHDEQLGIKVIELISELPTRSVPTLRRLLSVDEQYGEKIGCISDRTIYRFLTENGLSRRERFRLLREDGRRAYHAFEAPHSLALVQGDARDGIWISFPDGKTKKSYLFLWLDDFSRKILFGKYYDSEKLPCLEDSFKYMILRWGIPVVIYSDNGKIYISRHFMGVLAELEIKQLRHKPYQAYAKGKVESIMRTVKREFQQEAQLADFHTLEELNSAFWAWVDVVYNKRVHSATGETPDERFLSGLPENHRRISDLESFNRMFLWKESRTVSKYGKIKLYSNQYPVQKTSHGTVVQVRFDPFDLSEVYIYDANNRYLETTSPSKKVTDTAPNIPEESRLSSKKVSQQSVALFSRLREKHRQQLKKGRQMPFSKLFNHDKENNNE
ncbi:MAG: Mu transposase C-terminal domain-containing protein [Candidatus Hydrothermarchaeaceae archaeon]